MPRKGKDASHVRTPFSGEVITHPDRLYYKYIHHREKDMVCSKLYLGNDWKMKEWFSETSRALWNMLSLSPYKKLVWKQSNLRSRFLQHATLGTGENKVHVVSLIAYHKKERIPLLSSEIETRGSWKRNVGSGKEWTKIDTVGRKRKKRTTTMTQATAAR